MLRGILFVRLCLVALPTVLACAQELPRSNNTASNPSLASILEHMQAAQADTSTSAAYQVIRK